MSGRFPRPRWSPGYPQSRPRRVEGGLKARSRRGQIGETWWSQRFIRLLESFQIGARLQRGRHYARAGQVLELEVTAGAVRASVQGSRARPYTVHVQAPLLPEPAWEQAEAAMAGRATFIAKLLAGEMPHDIEAAFTEAGESLFPASKRELASSCSCPDPANPCKHVAAVYYLLAEAFDDDPFLILAWRGRSKEALLAHLRALRAAEAPDAPAVAPLADRLETFWSAGDLTGLRIRPQAAAVPDALPRQLDPPDLDLGEPGGVRGQGGLADLLAPAYATLTTAAERLALGDDPD